MANLVEIRFRGQLDSHWADWFAGFQICHREAGETTLTGLVPDQAALYGLLAKLRNLGLELISVNRVVENDRPNVK